MKPEGSEQPKESRQEEAKEEIDFNSLWLQYRKMNFEWEWIERSGCVNELSCKIIVDKYTKSLRDKLASRDEFTDDLENSLNLEREMHVKELAELREQLKHWEINQKNENVKHTNKIKELKEALKEIMRFESSMRVVMSENLVTPTNFLEALNRARKLLDSSENTQ